MTPTSDERREVAARLRNEGRALTAIDVGTEIASLTLDNAIGIAHNATWDDCSDRLADLIDPTCHVSDEEVTHQPTLDAMAVHVYTCDRCNSPFYMGDVCMHPKPLYCPYCGARVVDGSDV